MIGGRSGIGRKMKEFEMKELEWNRSRFYFNDNNFLEVEERKYGDIHIIPIFIEKVAVRLRFKGTGFIDDIRTFKLVGIEK